MYSSSRFNGSLASIDQLFVIVINGPDAVVSRSDVLEGCVALKSPSPRTCIDDIRACNRPPPSVPDPDSSYDTFACGTFFFPSLLSIILRDPLLATFVGHPSCHHQGLSSIFSKMPWNGPRSGSQVLWMVGPRRGLIVSFFAINPSLSDVDVDDKTPNPTNQAGPRIEHVSERS